jgi:hypothetical protein
VVWPVCNFGSWFILHVGLLDFRAGFVSVSEFLIKMEMCQYFLVESLQDTIQVKVGFVSEVERGL